MIPLIYKGMCPNCKGDIDSERLYLGLPCKKCLKSEVPSDEICDILKSGEFLKICNLKEKINEFSEYFKNRLGFDIRDIQKSWATRFFLNISYALLAPTGVGKTTFGLLLASYLSKKEKVSYLIFPTQLLAEQAFNKLLQIGVKKEDIAFYSSKLSNSQKEEIKSKISKKEFKIVITTTMFLYKNFSFLPKDFDFIFVDDVDSILKSAKNIDKILMLLGFDQDDIQKTLDFIIYKRKLFSKPKISQKELEEFNKKNEEIKKIAQKRVGNLMVSSATANPKSKRVLLFRELLGFEVSKPSITIRNIEDLYKESENVWEESVFYIKKFKKGGLAFLSSNETKETLQKYVEFLNQNKIKAISYEELDENLQKYKSGEIDVIVGFASYKNPLARGIDLPDVIRYAIFVGVPKLEFKLDIQKHSQLFYFLLILNPLFKNIFDQDVLQKVASYINFLKKILYLPQERLNENAKKTLKEIISFIESILTKELIEKINLSEDISLKKTDNGFSVVTADVTGYIQASGRTSRLFVGGLTKGLSFVLVDDKKAFSSLVKKTRWFSEEIEFKRSDEVDIENILKEIDEDREKVKMVLKGEYKEKKEFFKTSFMIVESPNKAKTIASFYGKPLRRKIKNVDIYEVATKNRILNIAASKGHIFDLNKEEGYWGVLKNGEFTGIYELIDENKIDIVNAIRELDLEVSEIFIATDPDIEGEKIGFDIYLNSLNFNKNVKRAEFHEVTKRAIDEALENKKDLDENLVKAQLVRRIADRWIGFEISKFLQSEFGRKTLSAGRVQSAVLEWIVKREDEVKEKEYIARVYIDSLNVDFIFNNIEERDNFFENLKRVNIEFTKESVEKLFKTPFSTDSMLFEASNELRFSPRFTMQLAQDLFEAGFITYHRTDSIRVSNIGINVAKEYITSHFKKDFFSPRSFKSKEGAHECIRPTKPMDVDDLREFIIMNNIKNITKNHLKLYDLIFKNFIASQMREVVVKKIEATALALDQKSEFSFISEIIQDGFNKILPIKVYNIKEGDLDIVKKEKLSKTKVPRYTFATLVKEMKQKGIGRPSTYAIIIQRLFERRYLFQKNGVIFVTNLGKKVYEKLKSSEKIYHFVNEKYTKELENIMDRVEKNQEDYQKVLRKLYKELQIINKGE